MSKIKALAVQVCAIQAVIMFGWIRFDKCGTNHIKRK